MNITIAGAIFDLDGTLLDSMAVWNTLGERYLKQQGIAPRRNIKKVLQTMSQQQAAKYFQQTYGLEKSTAQITQEVTALLFDFYAHTVEPTAGAFNFLRLLKEHNIPMCVATASPIALAKAGLQRTGLAPYFSAVFTAESVGAGKDSPQVFHQAHNALGTAKEHTVVFEDAFHAIQTAVCAGFPVIALEEPYEKQNKEEILRLADGYFSSFDALLRHCHAGHCLFI